MTDPTPPTAETTPPHAAPLHTPRTLIVEQAARTLASEATKQGITRPLADLADDLEYALSFSGAMEMDDMLLLQARVLDSAFHTLLPKYDPKHPAYIGLSYYNAAFKAQQQCCRTIRVLTDMRKRKSKKTQGTN